MQRTIIRELSSQLQRLRNCVANNNLDNRDDAQDKINELINFLPSGSGIDCGTKLDFDKSNQFRIVLLASFHHMNDVGMYDGWTEHNLIVTPSFDGIDIRITGRNRNDIKDYLADIYYHALREEVIIDKDGYRFAHI